jgi:hypothetical protein
MTDRVGEIVEILPYKQSDLFKIAALVIDPED